MSSLSQTELLEVYKVIMEEYRYQVTYNWDRLRYCLTSSLILTSIAFWVLYTGGGKDILAVAALLGFGVGGFIAWIGIRALRKGIENYRRVRRTKKLVENVLNLHSMQTDGGSVSFAIKPTEGPRERARDKPFSSRLSRWLLRRTTNDLFVQVLRLALVIDSVGALASAYELVF